MGGIVYLTMYVGDKMPKWYIGSSKLHRVINENYHGSVSSKKYHDIWKKELNENPHLFKTRVLSYHEEVKDALTEELRLHKKHDVVKNENYINESFASENGFFGHDVEGNNNPNYGKKWNNEQKRKASEYRKSDKFKSVLVKGHRTKLSISIDGLNIYKRAAITPKAKVLKTIEEKKFNRRRGTEKCLKTKSIVGDDGLNVHQRSSKKTHNTKMCDIDENGLNNYQRAILKRKMNDEKYDRKYTRSKNCNAKVILIYNEENLVIYECNGDFKEICKNENLPYGPLMKSYKHNIKLGNNNQSIAGLKRTNKEKYIGWYAKIKEK